jgi:6-phosphogluconate dehydrogenase
LWLVDLMEREFRGEGGIGGIADYVEDTGEVNWLINDAARKAVPVPVIGLSVTQLIALGDRDREWARAIAAMRNGFGGHPFGPNVSISRERDEGRVGGYPAPPNGTVAGANVGRAR